MTQENS